MTDAPAAIVYKSEEDGLWYAQEQGVNGRETVGGYATREGAIFRAMAAFGENVAITVEEPSPTECSVCGCEVRRGGIFICECPARRK